MNLDLSRYEAMRDNGASLLNIAKQLRSDGVDDIDFYAVLGSIFGEVPLEDAKTFIIYEGKKRSTLVDWTLPDDPEIEKLAEIIWKRLHSMPNPPLKTVFLSQRAPVHQKAMLDAAPPELEMIIPENNNLEAALADAVYLISERQGKIDTALLEKAPRLKLILRLGSQSHDIDLEAANARGIMVCTWPQASVARVAEHCVLQMLALVKHLNDAQSTALSADNFGRESKRTDENTFAYNWSKRENIGSIFGKTIGILGFGEIGFELAKRLQSWGVTLLYYKRQRLPVSVEIESKLRYSTALFRESDILVNLLPYSAETDNYINAERLASMKASAFLISVGSGAVIDESALAEALKSRKLAGAALDTYEFEPVPSDNPLLPLARTGYNLLLTPHTAAGTMSNLEERREQFTNILRHIYGEALLNRLV